MEQNRAFSWKGKSRGGALGYLCFILTIRYLGIKAAYILLSLVVPYFVLFTPSANRAIWYYNRKILKYDRIKSFVKLFVHYYTFGQTLIDKIAVKNGMAERYTFDFGNYGAFLKQLDSGNGVVMIGAHVGNWEIGTPFFNDYAKRINIVMFDGEYQQIKKVLGDNADFKSIVLNSDSWESIFQIKAALDAKEYVCFQGDRYMNVKNSIEINFLGREAKMPAGPFMVASRMQVPVVFYFAMRERGCRYKFHFVIAEPFQKNGKETKEEQLLKQYVTSLEEIVRSYPQQWFNFYKFWCK